MKVSAEAYEILKRLAAIILPFTSMLWCVIAYLCGVGTSTIIVGAMVIGHINVMTGLFLLDA